MIVNVETRDPVVQFDELHYAVVTSKPAYSGSVTRKPKTLLPGPANARVAHFYHRRLPEPEYRK